MLADRGARGGGPDGRDVPPDRHPTPPFHPQVTALLERIARANRPPLWSLRAEEARREYARSAVLDIAARPVAQVLDLRVPGGEGEIPARLYRDRSATPASGPAGDPLLVFAHGGGFTVGSIEGYDAICRMLALDARCTVLSLDYRLAPEHRFPAAAEDVFAASHWALANASSLGCDPHRVAFAGDSAGGTLVAQAAVRLRDAGLAPCAQLLVYPGTGPGRDTDSHRRFADGPLLDARTIDWFFAQYGANDSDRRDPRFAPLLFPNLAGLPPTLILLAQCDPLHDDGVRFARRLLDCGVDVEVCVDQGMIHGYFNMGAVLDAARDAHARAAYWLRRHFAPAPSGFVPPAPG